MKAIRQTNLEEMTTPQLQNKRNDVVECIRSSKYNKDWYTAQLEYLDNLLSQRLQTVLEFERFPKDDEQE